MKYGFVFPGQGSQTVGMGADFARGDSDARAIFEQADEALGFPLSAMCWEGPEEALGLTVNTQPAILTVSIAAWTVLRKEVPRPSLLAGHSLGEYSALVAAGVLRFEDAVRLVRERGRLMQEAVPVGQGAMAAVLGPEASELEAVAARAAAETGEVCSVANYNAPGQTVLAGSVAAVSRAMELAKEIGARRSIALPVSAPFHCALMEPARTGMTPLLMETEFSDARVPVVCNIDARVLSKGSDLRDALIRQIDGPVRWVESVRAMIAEGVSTLVEVGPGSVLAGMIKRIDRGASTTSVKSVDGVTLAVELITASPAE